jgi:VIT1/CCC1 family predicted Fe2+/Mn2+ transporter
MLVAGVAGLLAGAFSMALGEWISVTSSRELATRELHFAAGDLEELGIDPAAPGGSASEAAAFSFVLFALGAAVPVLPFLVARGGTAMASSLVLSAAALFGTGAGITVFTGVSAWRSGIRQLLMGLTAAGVTFGIGKLIGIVVTG